MTRDQQAHEAHWLNARLREAAHTAWGDVAIGASVSMRLQRLLDEIARPIEPPEARRKRAEEHAS